MPPAASQTALNRLTNVRKRLRRDFIRNKKHFKESQATWQKAVERLDQKPKSLSLTVLASRKGRSMQLHALHTANAKQKLVQNQNSRLALMKKMPQKKAVLGRLERFKKLK